MCAIWRYFRRLSRLLLIKGTRFYDNCSLESAIFLVIYQLLRIKNITLISRNRAQIMHLVVKAVNDYRYTLSISLLRQPI